MINWTYYFGSRSHGDPHGDKVTCLGSSYGLTDLFLSAGGWKKRDVFDDGYGFTGLHPHARWKISEWRKEGKSGTVWKELDHTPTAEECAFFRKNCAFLRAEASLQEARASAKIVWCGCDPHDGNSRETGRRR